MLDTILIVDDETDLLTGIERTLNADLKSRIFAAENGKKAMDLILTETIDLVLLDVCMPEVDGVELLEFIKKHDPLITVIMMTAYGSVEVAVETLKKGAYDFLKKPFEMDHLVHTIRKGLERNRLLRENRKLQAEISSSHAGFNRMIGNCDRMREVYGKINILSTSDVTVLILGETGTGKDLAARAIHERSSRKDKEMITGNRAAVPAGSL